MIVIKKIRSVLTLLALMAGLAGCNVRVSPEELLEPPKLFEEDERISELIEESLPDGAKLENINSKEGLSAVKKSDIDGDEAEEILVFYSKEDESSLHMMVFRQEDSVYEKSMETQVSGKFFDEMLLEDITGDGTKEIVVNTSEKRVQNGSYNMNIYAYNKNQSKFFEIEYNKYLIRDLNGDDKADIVVLNQEERVISIDYYGYNEKSEQIEFVSETLLEKRDISDMVAVDTDGGTVKVLLEVNGQNEGEKERIFLVMDEEGKLKSEEE